jgi:hypothetical protein
MRKTILIASTIGVILLKSAYVANWRDWDTLRLSAIMSIL